MKLSRTFASIGVALLSLPLAAPAQAEPAAVAAAPQQWIVVGVPAASATSGTLTAYQTVGDQWKVVLGPVTHVHSASDPSAVTENLYDSGPVYDYAVNIAVNPNRVPGKVSGIFLHVTDGTPTWGCVAIGRDDMKSVLTWLDPAQSPRITIGVGSPGLVKAS